MDIANRIEKVNVLVAEALANYDEEFRIKHADALDFGCCGSGVVLVSFGRKIKLKRAFESSGVLGNSWDFCGKRYYNIKIPSGTVPTQYSGYYSDRVRIAEKIFNAEFENDGIRFTVHTWAD